MTRLPKLEVHQLDAGQRALYESIANGPRAAGPFPLTDAAGRLEGPFNAMLLRPGLGETLQALGAAIRYHGTLSDRAREIAILVVAVAAGSEFERYAHEAAGRSAGLTDRELRALRDGDHDALSDDTERLIATTTHVLASRGDLTDDEFARASDALGHAGLFELTTLVGYYATLALQLRVFRVPLPDRPSP